jgi:hypothetical protein
VVLDIALAKNGLQTLIILILAEEDKKNCN